MNNFWVTLIFGFLITNVVAQSNNGHDEKIQSNEIDSQEQSTHKRYLGLKEEPSKYNFVAEHEKLKSAKLSQVASSYDLRTVDGGKYITPVKNQGSSNTCWTFATMGAVESYILKNGGSIYDFSEQNMATCNGYSKDVDAGGNTTMAMSYFANLKGPVNESDAPFTLPNNETCVANAKPVRFVKQLRVMPGSSDDGFDMLAVKNAVMSYGALYVNLYIHDNYYNKNDYTYYYKGSNSANHAVLLVGWDDNKVVTGNGHGAPSKKGAWIIRNSWGTNWGENGFFYLSYEDTKGLSKVSFYPSNLDYDENVKAYYYDEAGMTSSTGYGDDEAYGLARFSIGKDEIIKEFAVNLRSGGEVEATFYSSFANGNLSGKIGEMSTQACEYPGFHTFAIDNPIVVDQNMDVYVKYRVKTPSYNYPISREGIEQGYNDYSTIEDNRFWVSSNGSSWTAYGSNTNRPYDLCVRIYTATKLSTSIGDDKKINDTYGIKVFPNPSKGDVNIKLLDDIINNFSLKVFDATGQVVFTTQNSSEEIVSIKDLPSGLYVVQVSNGGKVKTSKFIVK